MCGLSSGEGGEVVMSDDYVLVAVVEVGFVLVGEGGGSYVG